MSALFSEREERVESLFERYQVWRAANGFDQAASVSRARQVGELAAAGALDHLRDHEGGIARLDHGSLLVGRLQYRLAGGGERVPRFADCAAQGIKHGVDDAYVVAIARQANGHVDHDMGEDHADGALGGKIDGFAHRVLRWFKAYIQARFRAVRK